MTMATTTTSGFRARSGDEAPVSPTAHGANWQMVGRWGMSGPSARYP
jgi:hypothetical protein